MNPVRPQLSAEELEAQVRRAVEVVNAPKIEPHLQDLIQRIRFRLVGYTLSGEKVPWDRDLQAVQRIEKKLVVDPDDLQHSFEQIKAASGDRTRDSLANTVSSFSLEGGHAVRNSSETLERVRREGWIILAGIERRDGSFYSLGYNYGLDSMPNTYKYGDMEFASLDIGTLPAGELFTDPHLTAMNYRTSVLPDVPSDILKRVIDVPNNKRTSIRRIGIGSALKYLITILAIEKGKQQMSFNIGTIYDWESITKGVKDVRVRNTASYQHNIRYFQEESGHRSIMTPIVKKEGKGMRKFIGTVRWFARGDNVWKAQENQLSEKGVLKTRNWNIQELAKTAARFADQLGKEKKIGDHT